MAVGRSIRVGSAGLALLVMVVVLAVVGLAEAGNRDSPRERTVKCGYSSDSRTLSVRLKHVPIELPRGIPPGLERLFEELLGSFASAGIDLRIGEITVLDGQGGPPIACGGGTPTIDNTDTVLVRTGKRVSAGELFLDFRYGRLEPGATDEGDGASEVEFDVDLGGGAVVARMTRGIDRIALGESAGRNAINLNADEGSPDIDLLASRRDILSIQGGGSGDQLITTDAPPFSGAPDFLTLEGGQGDDVIVGSSGSDGIFGGGGSDEVEAGPGPDFILASGGARDRIDCGPGRDFVLLLGRGRHDLHACERKIDPGDFGELLKRRPRSARAAGIVLAGKLKTRGARVVAAPLRRWAVGASRR